MGKLEKNVKEFAFIGFILLAVLFGMQIMTFIFGNLGSADYLADVTQTATNESPAWLNISGYTLDMASQSNFSGGAVITAIWGNTPGQALTYNFSIPTANATVSSVGVVTNSTVVFNATIFDNVTLSYTSSHKTEAEVVSDETTNQSLRAVGDYSSQAGTQFTTLGIAITLILLIAVFLFFWKAFMGGGKGEGPGSFR